MKNDVQKNFLKDFVSILASADAWNFLVKLLLNKSKIIKNHVGHFFSKLSEITKDEAIMH